MGNKKQNILEINGRRYDARTGTALDPHHQPAVVKPVAVRYETDETNAPDSVPLKPSATERPTRPTVARKAAKHTARHKPQRSATLMRRTVRKPSASLKRHLRVQSHTSVLAEQPLAEVYHPPSFGMADDKRLKRASHVQKSHLIAHFNPDQPDYQPDYKASVAASRSGEKAETPARAKPEAKAVPRTAAPDIDDIFERAIQNATSHLEPAPSRPRKRRLRLPRKHARA